jgi:hypothetical protein
VDGHETVIPELGEEGIEKDVAAKGGRRFGRGTGEVEMDVGSPVRIRGSEAAERVLGDGEHGFAVGLQEEGAA